MRKCLIMNEDVFLKNPVSIGAKDCKSCRSRQTLQNEYLVAKFCFDTAENEPSKVSLPVGENSLPV